MLGHIGSGAPGPLRRVADNGGRTPKPFFQKMVGQVFKSGASTSKTLLYWELLRILRASVLIVVLNPGILPLSPECIVKVSAK
jgi:hypothetical protein